MKRGHGGEREAVEYECTRDVIFEFTIKEITLTEYRLVYVSIGYI